MNIERIEVENRRLKNEIRELKIVHCTVCEKEVNPTTMLSVSRKEHGLPRLCLRCVTNNYTA